MMKLKVRREVIQIKKPNIPTVKARSEEVAIRISNKHSQLEDEIN